MSVINQVLLNLEKRDASMAELGALPDHVQLPPEGARVRHWGWVAAGVAFAVAASTGWIAFNGTVAGPAHSPVAAGAESVNVASASASDIAARSDELERAYFQEVRAFRLSFELSDFPVKPAPHRGKGAPKVAAANREPLSSAQVLGGTRAESTSDATRKEKAAPAPSAASAAAVPVKPAVKVIATPPKIRKQVRDPTPSELAEYQYRKAVALLDQDQPAEAEIGLREALHLYPQKDQARQVLVGLLVQSRKLEEAERVLEEGVKLSPAQTGFNLTLARLQAHRGDNARAIATLENGIEYAHGSAEYSAFLATLLQREGKHEEAIKHFRAALRLRPNLGVWWVGLGISLQATNQPAAALDAYRRASAAGNLHPHVAALAEERMRQLQ